MKKALCRQESPCLEDSDKENDENPFKDGDKINKMTLRDVGKDGNCLFRAVSIHLFGDQDGHLRLRKNCRENMLQNEEEMYPFMAGIHEEDKDSSPEDPIPYTIDDYRAYVERLTTPGFWAGNEAIWTLVHQNNVKVVVHSYKNGSVDCQTFKASNNTRGNKKTYHGFFIYLHIYFFKFKLYLF